MEELLARFPEDFFPGRGFVLEGRQRTLPSGGRLDITFRDPRGRLWVFEVKADAVQPTVADQLIGYFEDLRKREPDTLIIPAVVAPLINHTVCQMFDRAGIDHFEIHEAEFRRVAQEKGIAVPDAAARRDGVAGVPPQSRSRSGAGAVQWIPVREDITPQEHAEVDSLISKLTSYPDTSVYWRIVVAFGETLKEDLKESRERFGSERLSRKGDNNGGREKLERWCHTEIWGPREQQVAPIARRISMLFFREVVGREPHDKCRACAALGPG